MNKIIEIWNFIIFISENLLIFSVCSLAVDQNVFDQSIVAADLINNVLPP